MDVAALLLELYGRVPPLARAAVDGLSAEQLGARLAPDTNPIGWLVWHLTRVQDHHVAELLESDQIRVASDWPSHFGLEPDPHNTGYGHTSDDVAAVRPTSPDALLGYLSAVDERTTIFLAALTASDLDRIVDRRWDPPVTLGVRLVSIADDSLQHVGQAAYARGLLDSERAAQPLGDS
ncbi:MAG: DinB family protein [Acidimicrobiia bacterium]